jgi:catechol 2,3-dioxygenase-like lactoylglutathione lyase family enzyme
MLATTKLGVARPTEKLEDVVRFYRDGVGLAELRHSENHGDIGRVTLGPPDAPYYLEFTEAHGELAGRAPTKATILVICLPSESEWTDTVVRMEKSGYKPVLSCNPFWHQHEMTFEDPDGYRVVLQHAEWER